MRHRAAGRAAGALRGTRLALLVLPSSAKAKRKRYPKLTGTYALRSPARHAGKKLAATVRITPTEVSIS